jgi:ribosomal protein L7/L12
MHANYKLNGTVELHFDTIEDMIILTKVFGVSISSPQPVTFMPMGVANDCATFVLGAPIRSFDYDGMSKEEYDTVVNHLYNGNLLLAVKFVKEFTGKGLKESKDYIDKLRITLKIYNN